MRDGNPAICRPAQRLAPARTRGVTTAIVSRSTNARQALRKPVYEGSCAEVRRVARPHLKPVKQKSVLIRSCSAMTCTYRAGAFAWLSQVRCL